MVKMGTEWSESPGVLQGVKLTMIFPKDEVCSPDLWDQTICLTFLKIASVGTVLGERLNPLVGGCKNFSDDNILVNKEWFV